LARVSVLPDACINVSGLLFFERPQECESLLRMAIGATKISDLSAMLTKQAFLVCRLHLGFLFAMWAVHIVNFYGPLAQPIPVQR